MQTRFKPHLSDLIRYQTSLGRDLEHGIRLDRNEKVSNFSPEVVAEILKQFQVWSLSASPESRGLYEKISKLIKVPSEQIYVTAGITEGVKFLFETLTNPGDNVIVLDPTYPMYSIYAKFYQTEYRKFEYTNLAPDWKSFESALDKKTALVMIPNPNLPVESCFTLDELRRIAERCQKNGTILLIDEAYHYFGAPSSLGLITEFDNVIVARSFSKAFGLAAIRLGFMVSSPENIAYVSKTRSLVESNSFSMGIASFFLDRPTLVESHVQEVKEGAEYIQSELTKMGLKWHGGNFTNGILIFLESESETKDLVHYLREKKIYIRGSFEAPYQQCVRISIGPKHIMQLFIQSLDQWISHRRAKKLI